MEVTDLFSGRAIKVRPERESEEWLVSAACELIEEATRRRLELPAVTGYLALEGPLRSPEPATPDATQPTNQ